MLGTSTRFSPDNTDVWVLPLQTAEASQADVRPLFATTFNEQDAVFSPDGRFIAYSSDESGVTEVYVVPYPGPGGKSKVSTGGGETPRWSTGGSELLYASAGRIIAAAVQTSPEFRVIDRRELFSVAGLRARTGAGGAAYDIAPDGTRFLALKQRPVDGQDPELRVVVNWLDELRRVPPAR